MKKRIFVTLIMSLLLTLCLTGTTAFAFSYSINPEGEEIEPSAASWSYATPGYSVVDLPAGKYLVDAYGAAGAAGMGTAGTHGAGGLGGRVQSTMTLSAPSKVAVYVGGTGSGVTGGYNGGGKGSIGNNTNHGGGGGGASDIRILGASNTYRYDETSTINLTTNAYYGPYMALAAGTYQVDWFGSGLNRYSAYDVCWNNAAGDAGNFAVARALRFNSDYTRATFAVTVPKNCVNVEIRLWFTNYTTNKPIVTSRLLTRISDRVLVAAGGGGGGGDTQGGSSGGTQSTGSAGGASAANGHNGELVYDGKAGGAGSSSGGAGGIGGEFSASSPNDGNYNPGGAGGAGGGWYGGGGGGGATYSGSGTSPGSGLSGVAGTLGQGGDGGSPAAGPKNFRFSGGGGGGGGGSNYSNASYISGVTIADGVRAGNGSVTITSTNTAPTNRNPTITGGVRGAGISITPAQIAADSDAGDVLYWNSTQVFLNSNLTGAVSDYITVSGMTVGSAAAATVTPTGRWFDASRLFYTQVKDKAGATVTASFKFTLSDQVVQERYGAAATNLSDGGGVVYGRIGKSTTNNVSDASLGIAGTGIYNPDGANIYTLHIKTPIAKGASRVIAADTAFMDKDVADWQFFRTVTSSSSYFSLSLPAVSYGGHSSVTINYVKAPNKSSTAKTFQRITLQGYSADRYSGTQFATQLRLDIVFELKNERPDYKADRLITVGSGATATLNIADLCLDDDSNNLKIKEVKVPTNEFIRVGADGGLLGDMPANSTFNNIAGNSVAAASKTTGEGSKVLSNFRSDFIGANKYISVSSTDSILTIKGENRTRYKYNEAGRLGDFYILVRVEDGGDLSDTGIWFPVAVKVTNVAPVAVEKPSVELNAGESKIYSPMGIGGYLSAGAVTADGSAPALAKDDDQFDTGKGLNEFLTFTGNITNSGSEYITTEYVDLYILKTRLAELIAEKGSLPGVTAGGAGYENYYVFKGIKATAKKYTFNYYVNISASTVDASGASVVASFGVKVHNSALQARNTAETLGGKVISYTAGTGSVNSKIVYNIPNEDNTFLYITPYDLMTDRDMNILPSANIGLNTGFNANNAAAVSAINAKRSVSVSTTGGGVYAAKTIGNDYLSFQGLPSVTGTEAIVTYTPPVLTAGEAGVFDYRAMDYIKVDPTMRTVSGSPIKFTLTVTDSSNSLITARKADVEIIIKNTAPTVKSSVANTVYKMSADPNMGSGADTGMYNVRQFTESEVLYDVDTVDVPKFISNERPVAYSYNGSTYTAIAGADNYLNLRVDNGALIVEAHNSTLALTGDGVVYIGINITDGNDVSKVYFKVKVENSAPRQNNNASNYGFNIEGGKSVWNVNPNNSSEITRARYVASNSSVLNKLIESGVSAGDVKLLSEDKDKLQSAILDAPAGIVPTAASTEATQAEKNNAAVLYANPFGTPVCEDYVGILYYDADFNPKVYGAGVAWDDNPNWAVKIQPSTAFNTAAEITFKIKDEVRFGGDSAVSMKFTYFIDSLGLINNHTAYTENSGKYSLIDDSGNFVDVPGAVTFAGLKTGYVSGAKETIIVPMSYFAMPASLSTNALNEKATYAGYASTKDTVQSGETVSVFNDLKLSDGTNVWTGAKLSENPYLNIETVSGAAIDWANNAYVNKVFAELNSSGNAVVKSDAQQQKFKENLFGLSFTKKHVRTPVNGLSLEIKVCERNSADQSAVADKPVNTVKITVKTDNTPISLQQDEVYLNMAVGEDKTLVLQQQVGGQPDGRDQAYADALKNSRGDNVLTVNYTDGDYLAEDANPAGDYTEYRDKAMFLADSLTGLTDVQIERIKDAGVILSDADKAYINKYFRGNLADKTAGYTHNKGTFEDTDENGVNSLRNAYNYMDIIPMGRDSRHITVHPLRKTMVSTSVMNEMMAMGKTREQVLAERGLEEKNGVIYYVLRVLLYDTFSDNGFTESSFSALTVFVSVGNSAPVIGSTVGTPVGEGGDREFSVNLALRDTYTLNISEIIIDKDILKIGDNYVTEESLKNATLIERETRDYLMPTLTAFSESGNITGEGEKAVKWTADNTSNRLAFEAEERIGGSVKIGFKFSDSVGASTAQIIFNIMIMNQTPVEHENVNVNRNITMKVGDYFNVITTPYGDYSRGPANSETYTNYPLRDVVLQDFNYATSTTAFDNNTGDNSQKNMFLGNLPLATDDTAWTMRIINERYTSGNGIYTKNYDMVKSEVSLSDPYYDMLMPMVVRVRGESACENVPLTFRVRDGEGAVMPVTIYVTIVSSIPEVQTSPTKRGLTYVADENYFEYEMKNGTEETFLLKDFAVDKDSSDETNKMWLKGAYNGNVFSINASAGNSTEYIELVNQPKIENATFKIRTKNFISAQKVGEPYEEIKFRINDAVKQGDGGTASVEITLRLKITHNALTNPLYDDQNVQNADITSRSEFLDNGRNPDIVNVMYSSTNTLGIFNDKDYGPSSITAYDMRIMAMIEYDSSDRTFTGVAADDYDRLIKDYTVGSNTNKVYNDATPEIIEDYMIMQYVGGRLTLPSLGTPAYYKNEYISQYFQLEILNNGVEFKLTPINATIEFKIRLFVEIDKRVLAGENTEIKRAGGLYDFTVGNSAPISISDNAGLLNFSGVKGEEKTFKVFDRSNIGSSLFDDSDKDDSLTVVPLSVNQLVAETYTLEGHTYKTNPGWKATQDLTAAIRFTDNGNGTVTVKILRRIDAEGEDKSEPVVVPVKVKVIDRMGADNVNVINVIVQNSKPEFKEVKRTGSLADFSIERTVAVNSYEDDDYVYTLKTSLNLSSGKLIIPLKNIVTDVDFDEEFNRNDSFNFITMNDEQQHYFNGFDKTIVDERENPLFKISTNAEKDSIIIEALSNERGKSGKVYVMLGDRAYINGSSYRTSRLTVNVMIANTKPFIKPDALTQLNLSGGETGTVNGAFPETVIDILDYVDDINPGDKLTNDKSRTFLNITAMALLPSNEISHTLENPDEVVTNLVGLDYVAQGNNERQKVYVRPNPKIYGGQTLRLYILDDGIGQSTDATEEIILDLRINVTRDPKTQLLNTITIPWKKVQTVTVTDLLYNKETGQNNGIGYILKEIRSDSANIAIDTLKDADGNVILDEYGYPRWTVKALIKTSQTTVTTVFQVGKETYEDLTFTVKVSNNNSPTPLFTQKKFSHKKIDTETDIFLLDNEHTVRLKPTQLYDDPEGDQMRFISVTATPSVRVTASIVNNELVLVFKASGEAKIKVVMTDETDVEYTRIFTTFNEDMPPLNFFTSIVANMQTNSVMWICIAVGVGILIIVIAILAGVRVRRNRLREELEALLVSELEIEDTMLKLASSYEEKNNAYLNGFVLPPSQSESNPSMLLGQGGDSAPQPALQLNAGEEDKGKKGRKKKK